MDENAFEYKKILANDCFSGNITNKGIMRIMDRMTISECYNDEKSRVWNSNGLTMFTIFHCAHIHVYRKVEKKLGGTSWRSGGNIKYTIKS